MNLVRAYRGHFVKNSFSTATIPARFNLLYDLFPTYGL